MDELLKPWNENEFIYISKYAKACGVAETNETIIYANFEYHTKFYPFGVLYIQVKLDYIICKLSSF
jgi:hypothetical protein